jgi:hypothetical protein
MAELIAAEARIAALEAALETEESRHRRRAARDATTPDTFYGTLTESVEDFFTEVQRYLDIHEIDAANAATYVPSFLGGTAKEFFRTMTPPHHRQHRQHQSQLCGTLRERYATPNGTGEVLSSRAASGRIGK